MCNLRLSPTVGIVAALAACDEAAGSTPEPHPIEGRWQVVGLTTNTADGTRTFDLRDVSVPLTMELTDGAFEGRGQVISPTDRRKDPGQAPTS